LLSKLSKQIKLRRPSRNASSSETADVLLVDIVQKTSDDFDTVEDCCSVFVIHKHQIARESYDPLEQCNVHTENVRKTSKLGKTLGDHLTVLKLNKNSELTEEAVSSLRESFSNLSVSSKPVEGNHVSYFD
jgi:hypothetical protein